jgi:DNA replication and repair protein RecF
LGGFVEAAYSLVAPGKTAAISYLPRSFAKIGTMELPRDRAQLADLLRQEIDHRNAEELARGVTVVGPHRDDVLLVIGDLPAKAYASHGECWSLALALRLGSFELMRDLADSAGEPVLILDDVFAELDVTRRRALANVAVQAEQTLITAAVAQDVPPELLSNVLRVSPGTVVAAPYGAVPEEMITEPSPTSAGE